MTSPIDVRLECGDAAPPLLPGILCVPSDPAARTAGDLGRGTGEGVPRCLTYVPGGEPATSLLTNSQNDWQGLVRVVPDDFDGVILLAWLVDDLAATLARTRRALLIDVTTHVPWEGIFRLATTFPTLDLLIGTTPAINTRILSELMRQRRNVLVDTSGLGSTSIASLTNLVGASRLLFGSNSPRQSQEAALKAVEGAQLTGDERLQILRSNAEKLLGGR